jgi:hypothetical protein
MNIVPDRPGMNTVPDRPGMNTVPERSFIAAEVEVVRRALVTM